VTELSVHVAWQDGRALVTVAGDLDHATVSILRAETVGLLDTSECAEFTVDLAGLDFLDSSGLAGLLELHRMAMTGGAEVRLVNVPRGPARVIAIGGLSSLLGLPELPPIGTASDS
jgi:anti-anti-sigma factor